MIRFRDIEAETNVVGPNRCGLARVTRALFRGHSHKLNEYLGEALRHGGPGGVDRFGARGDDTGKIETASIRPQGICADR